ncbi:hypothetical protein C1N61_30195 (plasmid) [Priestia aryabhattai]
MNIISINWVDITFQFFWLIFLFSLGLFIWKVVKVKKQNKRLIGTNNLIAPRIMIFSLRS